MEARWMDREYDPVAEKAFMFIVLLRDEGTCIGKNFNYVYFNSRLHWQELYYVYFN